MSLPVDADATPAPVLLQPGQGSAQVVPSPDNNPGSLLIVAQHQRPLWSVSGEPEPAAGRDGGGLGLVLTEWLSTPNPVSKFFSVNQPAWKA